jgi:hypothetical protein
MDRTDFAIEALVTLRELGLSRVEVHRLADDTFDAPWSAPSHVSDFYRPTQWPSARTALALTP